MKQIVAVGLFLLINSAFAQPYGLNTRPPVGPFLNSNVPPVAPVLSGNWSTVVAFPNLLFTNAVGLAPVPGTNRLAVWEREGRMYTFQNNAATTTKTLVVNIANQCQGWDDSGLLGLAFHPGFVTNRYMFVWYNWVTPGTVLGNQNQRPPTGTPNRDRLSRFTLDANGVAIPGSETVFIDQNSATVWHNGGGMFFGDDGFLYITNGDDNNGAHNQRINVSLHSGVLRIDVDRRGGSISHAPPRQPTSGVTANYYIPNDNPFVGQANVLEEFFAIGLRSPHRMTFDPVSRRIFIGDVGAGSWEEISVIEPGETALNFQWDRIEGLNGDLTPPYIGVNKRPILHYSHSEGFAVIGGYVYRGSEFASDLGGRYIFGDNGSKRIWVMNEGTIPATKTQIATLPPGPGPNPGNDYVGLSSFGLDHNGEIYMCQMSSIGGRIYKLQRGGPTNAPLPRLLSQTGAFANTPALTPSSGLIAYDVASPLWSDAAIKTRWLAIPSSSQIGFATNGEWTFPNGSVFVKHFELPINDTNPAIRKRLETRLLVRETNGYVYGATYKWRADNNEADLLDSQVVENIAITTATGVRTQTWYYPSRQDCLACHTIAASGVLGVKTRQSNRDFFYSGTGVTDNQLRAWNHIGLFNPPVNESSISNLTRLVTVTNTQETLEFRVRSYLDANCSHCHRPAGVQALWDGRIETPLNQANIINGSLFNNLGISGARNVVPADVPRSVMHRRVNSVDPAIKMPPLARNVIDQDAVTAITQWITGLPPDQSVRVLVAQGSTWKYLDNNSDQGTAWTALGFNDTAWASGPAQLGYGDSDESTVVNGGPTNNRFVTTYFRQPFTVTNSSSVTNLSVRLLRDDGAVGYLNGTEIFRHNMPTGTITRTNFAANTVGDPEEDQFFEFPASPAALVEGANVLAVEIHQINATSSDISFDLELTAYGTAQAPVDSPPTVAFTSPTTGAVFRVGTNILLTATAAASGTNVSVVEFFAGAAKLGQDTTSPYQFTWSNVVPGAYQLTARATDARGLGATSLVVSITVNPSNLPPQVTLTSPANGATFGTPANISIAANASDPDGAVARVEFYRDATKVGEDTVSPYSLTVSNVPTGNYSFRAVAIDNEGASTASAVANVSVILAPVVSTNALVARGAIWRYLDDGSNQGANWIPPGFNDTAWAAGAAQLGYSTNPAENDEATVINGGPVGSRFITYYFRRAFQATNASSYTNLAVSVLRDDGAVVYLNGVEVFRSNMPGGPVNYLTLASSAVTGAAETTQFFSTNVPPSALFEGNNVLAVEIHQVTNTSSDVSFDLDLIGVSVRSSVPPVLLHGENAGPNQFRLWFDAPSGVSFVIEASANLSAWTPVHTNAAVGGRFEWLDNRSLARRFYRARQQ